MHHDLWIGYEAVILADVTIGGGAIIETRAVVTKSGCKYEIERRNRKIRKDYQLGKSVDELADTYYLSVHLIRKIIYEK